MKRSNIRVIIISFALVFLILIVYFYGLTIFPFLSNNNLDSYRKIKNYVNKNISKLDLFVINKINNNDVEQLEAIKDINIYENNENIVIQFETGGKGLVPSSTYYGFYYSKKDIPIAFDNNDFELEKIDDNKWKWQDVGDNFGITIRIKENWFYFEASF